MTPKVPTIERGTAKLGMMVARTLRKNTKMTNTTSTMVSINSNWTSETEARIVVVRSVSISTFTAVGSAACSCGSNFLTRSTTAMMLAPGGSRQDDGGILVCPGGLLHVLYTFEHGGHVGESNRRAVAIGNDQRPVAVTRNELNVGVDGVSLMGAIERSLGLVNVGLR